MTTPDELYAQIACLREELSYRVRLYPAWIREGKLSQEKADRRLTHLRGAIATLEGLVQPSLFPEETPHA